MVIEKRRDLIPKILGGCEETTTGIKRLKSMQDEGLLPFPMLAVNDAQSKYLFDNRYGTGQSVWDAILRTTNLIVAGKNVVIAGYGWCGKGAAKRAAGLGARVIVVEVDPHRALEALMDGFKVMNMIDAAKVGDVFITVTGNTKVIRREHFMRMKDGVLLCNAGHFDVEICIPDLAELAEDVRETRETSHLYPSGRKEAAPAWRRKACQPCRRRRTPVEIMDMSFAMQLLSCIYISSHKLGPGLYNVPAELDRRVAELKLESLCICIEQLTQEQKEYLATWKEA